MANGFTVLFSRLIRSRFEGPLMKGKKIRSVSELEGIERRSRLVVEDEDGIIKMKGRDDGTLRKKRRKSARGRQGDVETFEDLSKFLRDNEVLIVGSSGTIGLGDDLTDNFEKFELSFKINGNSPSPLPVLWDQNSGGAAALVFNKRQIFGNNDPSNATDFEIIGTRNGTSVSMPITKGLRFLEFDDEANFKNELEDVFLDTLKKLRLEMMWYVQDTLFDEKDDDAGSPEDIEISEISSGFINLEDWIKEFMINLVNGMRGLSEPAGQNRKFSKVIKPNVNSSPRLYNRWGQETDERKILDFKGEERVRVELSIESGELAGWSKVSFDGLIGFMKTEFLEKLPDTASL